jgi:hypothetical protein
MKAAIVMRAGRQGEGEAAGDLIAGDDAGERIGAGGSGHLGGGEGGRDHRRAGMQRGRRMGVVEIERMGERAIQQRRPRRCIARGVAKHPGIAGAEAERAGGGEQSGRALRVMAGTHDVADQIEQQKPRPLGHFRRQCLDAEPGRKGGEFGGDAHDTDLPIFSMAYLAAD